MSVRIILRKGETVVNALRRLKRWLDVENVFADVRGRRYYVKPSEKNRKKKKDAIFNNKVRMRREDGYESPYGKNIKKKKVARSGNTLRMRRENTYGT
ncbi:MAG: 30S ribosomal protein S21 [Puniceicoccales bacterium]|nr:30S ribosomal protein S21 [Puniceicoccales bacterium]